MTQALLACLDDRAMEAPGLDGTQLVIEKELLHDDILFALEQVEFLEGLVFQGGTALKLCLGAPRSSSRISTCRAGRPSKEQPFPPPGGRDERQAVD